MTRAWWCVGIVALGACQGAGTSADGGPARDLPAADVADGFIGDHPEIRLDTPPCPAARADVPAAPTPMAVCCDAARCAPHGMRCDPSTCRCAVVPCEREGEACPSGAIPGLPGPFVCSRDLDGLSCHKVAAGVRDCPQGQRWCGPGDTCVCGVGACRVFGAACPMEQRCEPWDRAGLAGGCQPARDDRPEGAFCNAHRDCASNLVCTEETELLRCASPDCGLAPDAPACPAGRVCRLFAAPSILGMCRVPCDPFDVRAPCAANERCRADSPDAPAFCTPVRIAPLPALSGRCENLCRTGATCVEEICRPACRPDAVPGAVGACAAGEICHCTDAECACMRACDPFGADPACASRELCEPYADPCGSIRGRCRWREEELPGVDGYCGNECRSGLTCTRGQVRRCRPLCVPGITAGRGACGAGERCVRTDPAKPFGACVLPCVAGDGDCPNARWCEPQEIDPATGRWQGYCS